MHAAAFFLWATSKQQRVQACSGSVVGAGMSASIFAAPGSFLPDMEAARPNSQQLTSFHPKTRASGPSTSTKASITQFFGGVRIMQTACLGGLGAPAFKYASTSCLLGSCTDNAASEVWCKFGRPRLEAHATPALRCAVP
jgi:hypothetical protein